MKDLGKKFLFVLIILLVIATMVDLGVSFNILFNF